VILVPIGTFGDFVAKDVLTDATAATRITE
jgi:hypothetical protein